MGGNMELEALNSKYIKFLICARRKRNNTQEHYFYEWGNIHVALMLTTPEVMRVFKRYVQHFSVSDISSEQLIFPLSEMEWDNMADHWIETYDDFVVSLTANGYVKRVQPHKFGDDAFELSLAKGRLAYQKEGFRSGGGVKLIHWIRKNPELSSDEFDHRYFEHYGPAMIEAAGLRLRKYVQNTPLKLDAERFRGTLFEKGGVGKFAAVDEIWFDSIDDLVSLRENEATYSKVQAAIDGLVDPNGTFSMVTTERIVFDFITQGEQSPPPSIHDASSLEAHVDQQGYADWNIPRLPNDAS